MMVLPLPIQYVNSLFTSISYNLGEILIDPGDEWDGFNDVKAVLLTHAHFDHIYGLNRVLELNPDCIVYTNEMGKKMLTDPKLNMSKYRESPFVFHYNQNVRIVKDGVVLNLGEGNETEVYETPGHNPSCLTFIIGNNVFTGDAYIPGIKTVTNLPFGDKEMAARSIERIKALANGRTIYPGHQCLTMQNLKGNL